MKKKLVLLTLIIGISGVLKGEQDFLKSLTLQSELRVRYVDQTGTDRNKVGNGGFSSNNKQRSRWRNTLNGKIALIDEYGLDANFRMLRNGTNTYTVTDGEKFRKNGVAEAWETEFFLSKDIKIGNLDSTWKLGWENKTNRAKQLQNSSGKWVNNIDGDFHTTGYSNEFYFGPSTTFNVGGLKLDTDFQLAYFSIKGEKAGDYYLNGSDFIGNRAEGWGINFNVGNKKNILEGKYGKLGYSVYLNNKFRNINKETLNGEKSKSNVYLDYIVDLTYSTPTYKGIYGQIGTFNEWEKYTAAPGYENTFGVSTTVGYKKSFKTSIGSITINPQLRYYPIYKYSYKGTGDRNTIEYNELRAGMTIGYTPNK